MLRKMSILVIKNDGIGDLVYASGIIERLSTIFGGNLDLVTCEQNKEIAGLLLGVRRCYFTSRDDLRFRYVTLFPTGSALDVQTIQGLRRERYDYVVCLRRFIRLNSLVLMSVVDAGAKHCCWQFPTNVSRGKAKWISRSWNHYCGDIEVIPELEYYHTFLESVFEQKFDTSPVLQGSQAAGKKGGKRTVGLGIGGSQQWPVKYWITLVEYFSSQGWQIALFGGTGRQEMGLAEDLVGKFSKCESFVGSTSLLEAIDQLKQLEIYVGNDTGLAHLASLYVNKCLIVLGGGTFGRFFPWPRSENQYVIYHGLPCFDCTWVCKYPEFRCLQKVQPEDVISYFEQIVSSRDAERIRNVNPAPEEYQVVWRHWHHDPIFRTC